ncbi:hypothetical protein GCM10018777_56510 [Streptomyces albogriseolus]|uniref:hypothetical protein n=1 Tax=Streptomyces albogriseolus TaxID=1887 RepID=UPI00167A7EF4|nr:hypothetical protein [Streptomyces viridodiastaticus]GHG33150.1 hypothetical protein GCM10018777_56510 [Streptomyces viridodiastaticus]
MSRNGEWTTSQSRSFKRLAVPHNGYREGVPGVEVGSIVVLERQAWRVLEIREKPEDLWPANYEKAWQGVVSRWVEHEAARAAGELTPWGTPMAAQPEPVRSKWYYRPVNVVLQLVDQPKSKPRHVVTAPAYEWQTLPEHFVVCRVCHELPPCRHVETEETVNREVEKAERLMAIPRGACLGCGEAITSRMKAIRFPGPNLWRPDWGLDSAVFHARRSREECSTAAWRYEEQWKAQGLDKLNPELPEGGSSGPGGQQAA